MVIAFLMIILIIAWLWNMVILPIMNAQSAKLSNESSQRIKAEMEREEKREEEARKICKSQNEELMERICSYLDTLPVNCPGKTCAEICNEILPNLTPQTVAGLLRLLKQSLRIDSCEVKGKTYFFILGGSKEEREKLEKKEQELRKQKQEKEDRERKLMSQGIWTVDKMDGHQFEHYCAGLLRKLNFTNVEVTKGSGDQGVDIVAVKEGVRYAIQCKCYSSSLGNSPVQEVNAGKQLYGCHVAVVLTNQHFTSGAKTLAAATGVLLWDREELERMIKKAGMANG